MAPPQPYSSGIANRPISEIAGQAAASVIRSRTCEVGVTRATGHIYCTHLSPSR